MEGFDSIIAQLERQKEAIDRALAALRWIEGTQKEVGNARSIGQKKRWAAKNAAPKKRGGITAAGRKRLAENMRKMWAAKRTAAQAKKRKKVA